MKLEYKLNADDFLTHQLYSSSKSESQKKSRNRARIIWPIVYTLFGLFLYYRDDTVLGPIMFSGLGILWLLFYPTYSKWRYKKHFEKHVHENYKNMIGQTVEFEFSMETVTIKDHTSESSIKVSELKTFVETRNHFFITLTTGLSIIIPKRVVENLPAFFLKMEDLKVDYLDELNWVWK